METNRQKIINSVTEEIYGPTDKNLIEILKESPLKKYFCGVLYPRDAMDEHLGEDSEGGEERNSIPVSVSQPNERADSDEHNEGKSTFLNLSDDEEDYLSLSNAFYQSALSITVVLKNDDELTIEASGAIYIKSQSTDPSEAFVYKNKNGEEKTYYPDIYTRKPIVLDKTVKASELGNLNPIIVCEEPKVILSVYKRWESKGGTAYTFSLVNQGIKKKSSPDYDQCFYQAKILIKSQRGILPIPRLMGQANSKTDDDKNNDLLYRRMHRFAIGHGCSPHWVEKEGEAEMVETKFVPSYKLFSIVPRNTLNTDPKALSMLNFAKGTKEDVLSVLNELCNEYSDWIDVCEEEMKKPDFENQFKDQAENNIRECRICLGRMRDGVHCLENDDTTFSAFQFMNKAMLLQQLHSRLPLLKYKKDKGNTRFVIDPEAKRHYIELNYEDPITWPGDPSRLGLWRAFQIAFVLINIRSIIDHSSADREKVDLIWFPTGGGKTEAYLGLTGFVIFYNRLTRRDDSSSSQVIMRYTLRLLTSQQYERAAALICACESMRRQMPESLGSRPITIGLWVGSKTTPNTEKDAVNSFKESYKTPYPFSITRCPYCGAEIGPLSADHTHWAGIAKSKDKIVFNCGNPDCEFHDSRTCPKEDKCLPLKVIDEDIYENPPTLLIATVDKFALLPLINFKARNIFGLQEGPMSGRSHPELIIQDELHLISGPLGSTVSIYETMIDFLCSVEKNGSAAKFVHPKIVASTATIARAKEQCHDLYDIDRENVKIFPPSGLENGETFFSYVDREKEGREYVGVFLPGTSAATGVIHLLSRIYVAKDEIEYDPSNAIVAKDAYWTNMCYFNSIRELARAATWVRSDVYEHAKIILRSQGKDEKANKLPLPLYNELNSRNTNSNLSEKFDELKVQHSDDKKTYCRDFCLATQMISVGLDIDRLGLMTIMGQPKTTAEYIQASSRVGRSSVPGLVFTVYGTTKPRDKSIFEDFENYHSRFYSFVEPTSISPFCSELRERALPAIIVGMTRAFQKEDGIFYSALEDNKQIVTNFILSRINNIDASEEENAKTQIDTIYATWDKWKLAKACYPFRKEIYKAQDTPSAIYPKDFETDLTEASAVWHSSYPAPTSMRDVDAECQMEVTDNYSGEEE